MTRPPWIDVPLETPSERWALCAVCPQSSHGGHKPHRSLCFLASVLLLIAIAGCGGPGDVQGKVTYRGKPVASGSVVILASDRLPHYGQIQKDGSFTISKVPAGEASVAVNSPDPRAVYAPVAPRLAKKTPPAPATPPVDPRTWFPLPAKLGDPTTSGLKATIVGGPNTLELNLKDD